MTDPKLDKMRANQLRAMLKDEVSEVEQYIDFLDSFSSKRMASHHGSGKAKLMKKQKSFFRNEPSHYKDLEEALKESREAEKMMIALLQEKGIVFDKGYF